MDPYTVAIWADCEMDLQCPTSKGSSARPGRGLVEGHRLARGRGWKPDGVFLPMTDQNANDIWAEMDVLRTPRPNGSRALRCIVDAVDAWLAGQGIAGQSHAFTLRPFSMEILGLWLLLGGLLLILALAIRRGEVALLVILGLVAVLVLETRFLRPTVTALVRRPARNLVVAFPAPTPRREVILCAHLDSKTELLDHERRRRLLDSGPAAMALGVAGALFLSIAPLLRSEMAAELAYYMNLFLGIGPAAVYALSMGANLAAGRLRRRPSSGAVDNGGAVVVLLDLARRLQRGEIPLQHTAVTLLFTVGEEAQMQGALAYVRDRDDWPLPVQVVNLEIVGQNGSYALWVEDGTAMRTLDADADLNDALARAVQAETGDRPTFAESINSDAFAFLRRGLPAATLGSLDRELGEADLHGPLDHADRIEPARLAQTADILTHFLLAHDVNPLP